MRDPLIGVMAVFGVVALIFLVLFVAFAAYDTMADNDMMDGMWEMMEDMGGMMGDDMGDMMGGGEDTSNAPVARGGMDESVAIRDFAYAPGNLEVPIGANVTWTNYDGAPHTASAHGDEWDTGIMNKGDHATITFDEPEDYSYYCKLHPNMKARIRVR